MLNVVGQNLVILVKLYTYHKCKLLGRPINSCRFYIGKLKFVCDCCLNNSINKFDINRKRRF